MGSGDVRRTSCPQCGAPLVVPRNAAVFSCSWCGATLHAQEGVPLHYLEEIPRFSNDGARELALAWLAGPTFSADVAGRSTVYVGPAKSVAFLRVRRRGKDVVMPLDPVSAPEMVRLSSVPADMRSTAETDPIPNWVDASLVRDALHPLAADAGVHDILIEKRLYYPLRYSYRGNQYSGVIPAAGGSPLSNRRPVRREIVSERVIAAGVVALLFSEALFVPGLALKLTAIAATGAGLFPLVMFLVRRYG